MSSRQTRRPCLIFKGRENGMFFLPLFRKGFQNGGRLYTRIEERKSNLFYVQPQTKCAHAVNVNKRPTGGYPPQ